MATKRSWLRSAQMWIKERRSPTDEPLVTQDKSSARAPGVPSSDDASDTTEPREIVGMAEAEAADLRPPTSQYVPPAAPGDRHESDPEGRITEFLTQHELEGDATADFETFVEDPNALTAESKLLLEGAGANEGIEGAAAFLQEQGGSPEDQMAGGIDSPIGTNIPLPVRGFDLDSDPGDPKADLLGGFDPGSLMDPRLAEGGVGQIAAQTSLEMSAFFQVIGLEDADDVDLQALGNLAAGDIVGDDTPSRVARTQVHQQIGSEPAPADQEATDQEAEKVEAEGGDADDPEPPPPPPPPPPPAPLIDTTFGCELDPPQFVVSVENVGTVDVLVGISWDSGNTSADLKPGEVLTAQVPADKNWTVFEKGVPVEQ
ncbi:MAG: hypothetical protein ACC658_09010, partial [Acidimicrobiia bacterium]